MKCFLLLLPVIAVAHGVLGFKEALESLVQGISKISVVKSAAMGAAPSSIKSAVLEQPNSTHIDSIMSDLGGLANNVQSFFAPTTFERILDPLMVRANGGSIPLFWYGSLPLSSVINRSCQSPNDCPPILILSHLAMFNSMPRILRIGNERKPYVLLYTVMIRGGNFHSYGLKRITPETAIMIPQQDGSEAVALKNSPILIYLEKSLADEFEESSTTDTSMFGPSKDSSSSHDDEGRPTRLRPGAEHGSSRGTLSQRSSNTANAPNEGLIVDDSSPDSPPVTPTYRPRPTSPPQIPPKSKRSPFFPRKVARKIDFDLYDDENAAANFGADQPSSNDPDSFCLLGKLEFD